MRFLFFFILLSFISRTNGQSFEVYADNNRVEVYNRWEVKVFEMDSYGDDNEWDGTPNVLNNVIIGDGQVPEGTYYYVIDLGENNSFGNNFVKGYVYIRRN